MKLSDLSTKFLIILADKLRSYAGDVDAYMRGHLGNAETVDELGDFAEQEYLAYLESIGAIREDGTIDRSKIKYQMAQTLEELEAILSQRNSE